VKVRKIKLGMKAWFPWSHNSWSGPHRVTVRGLKLPSSVLVVFDDDEEAWVNEDSVRATKREAIHDRDTWGKVK
jgi:hypothetical protein